MSKKKPVKKQRSKVSHASLADNRWAKELFAKLMSGMLPVEPVEQESGAGEEPAELFGPRGGFQAIACMDMVIARLGKVRSEGGLLHRYVPERGIWEPVKQESVGKIVMQLAGPRARMAQIEEVHKLMRVYLDSDETECRPDPTRVTLQNGIVKIDSRRRQGFSPDYNHKVTLPFPYDAKAECPLWNQALDEIFESDAERIELVQQIFGYCLQPGNPRQVFFLLIGAGANGKSVIANVLRSLIGPKNVCAVAPEKFGSDFVLGELRGKRVNIVNEIDSSRPMPSAVLKALTSQDPITVDVKYESAVTFIPEAKHMFLLNSMPRFRDSSYGLLRRVCIVQFDRNFTPEERDPELAGKLDAELSGIFLWALKGLCSLNRQGGFIAPAACGSAIETFEASQNPVLAFIRAKCCIEEGARIPRVKLYSRYERWHNSELSGKPLSRQQFYAQLRSDFRVLRDARIDGVDNIKGIRMKAMKKKPRSQGDQGGLFL